MDYTLANGDVIVLRDRSTLTQRMARPVEVAQTRIIPVTQKLLKSGFDESKPETWGAQYDLTPDEFQRLEDVKVSVIAAMVVQWPYTIPISGEGAEDLPADVFEEISSAAFTAFRGESFDKDTDPKADTNASTD